MTANDICPKCGAPRDGHEVDSLDCYRKQVRVLAKKLAEIAVSDFKEHNQLTAMTADRDKLKDELEHLTRMYDALVVLVAKDRGEFGECFVDKLEDYSEYPCLGRDACEACVRRYAEHCANKEITTNDTNTE